MTHRRTLAIVVLIFSFLLLTSAILIFPFIMRFFFLFKMHLRKKCQLERKKVNESSQSALRLEVGRPKSCLHDRFQLARLIVQTPASGMRGCPTRQVRPGSQGRGTHPSGMDRLMRGVTNKARTLVSPGSSQHLELQRCWVRVH